MEFGATPQSCRVVAIAETALPIQSHPRFMQTLDGDDAWRRGPERRDVEDELVSNRFQLSEGRG